MVSPFLLDTNAYYIFFQHPKHSAYQLLLDRLRATGVVSFYISEITSLEIHSVLGKYRRGAPMQYQLCNRTVVDGETHTGCKNNWIFPKRNKMKPKVYRDILKLISDIENGKGEIQVTILKIDSFCIRQAQRLLMKYSDQFSFGSHDALIAGSLVSTKIIEKLDLKLVTSDKGLQAVLREESISFLDPLLGSGSGHGNTIT